MNKVLDMQFIRYANIFSKITKIKTNHCFMYNNSVIFAVPRYSVPRAIGFNNQNLKKLSNVFGKKIKIVAIPNGKEDIENFISVIIYPVRFKTIEIKDGEVIINANSQDKACLIGRDKRRLNEMQNILNQYFGLRKIAVK